MESKAAAIFGLLQSALQINSLALAQTEAPNLYRILPKDRIPQAAVPARSDAELQAVGAAVPVTQVFQLRRGNPAQIRTNIQPFLPSPGSNVIAIPANRTLIVTDVASNVCRIARRCRRWFWWPPPRPGGLKLRRQPSAGAVPRSSVP